MDGFQELGFWLKRAQGIKAFCKLMTESGERDARLPSHTRQAGG